MTDSSLFFKIPLTQSFRLCFLPRRRESLIKGEDTYLMQVGDDFELSSRNMDTTSRNSTCGELIEATVQSMAKDNAGHNQQDRSHQSEVEESCKNDAKKPHPVDDHGSDSSYAPYEHEMNFPGDIRNQARSPVLIENQQLQAATLVVDMASNETELPDVPQATTKTPEREESIRQLFKVSR